MQDYLKKFWPVRRFFIMKYGHDPTVINGEPMPVHRNNSSQRKTMTFKNEDAFVKEHHNLSRE